MEGRPLFFGKDISATRVSGEYVRTLLDDAESSLSDLSSEIEEIANDLQFKEIMLLEGAI